MKRPNQEIAGQRPGRRVAAPVAGERVIKFPPRAASFRRFLQDPMAAVGADVGLIRDFEEFVAGKDEPAGNGLMRPDPTFRDRLRRVLWGRHVFANLRIGNKTH